jgi:hypothetical protein
MPESISHLGNAICSFATNSEPDEKTKAEAIALILAGLAEAELKQAASYTAPLIWTVRDSLGQSQIKGGSVFFLNTGKETFAVTAAHVVIDFFNDIRSQETHCAIAADGKRPLRIPLGDRIIDGSPEIDIATFRIYEHELAYLGRTVLQGLVGEWPPRLAEVDGPVSYCGFPRVGRRRLVPNERTFGCVPMGGLVSSSHETCISILLERDQLTQVLGEEPMPENFDFGGMSGGPVVAIIQSATMRAWKPAGVIFQGPNPGNSPDQDSIPGLEIMRARPIHFIKDDGFMDMERWHQSNFT